MMPLKIALHQAGRLLYQQLCFHQSQVTSIEVMAQILLNNVLSFCQTGFIFAAQSLDILTH